MRRPATAALMAAMLLGSGCSGEARTAETPASETPAKPSNASAGCDSKAPPASGRGTFGGRGYLLKRPNNDGRTPAPLILDLHGLRSTAFGQAVYGRMADTGAARGFIVVEPESLAVRQGWKLPGMPDGSDDIAYMGSLLDHLERTLCVDTSREYATGFSNGAGLATALICGLDGRLAGVAPVAGLNLARPCANAKPTTIVAFHGTADWIVPYRGGEPFNGNRGQVPDWMVPTSGYFSLPAVGGLASRWARTFRCGTGQSSAVGAGDVTRLTYPRCARGARVDLYAVRGGGHTWPGAFPIGIGRTTTSIDATKLILDAFT